MFSREDIESSKKEENIIWSLYKYLNRTSDKGKMRRHFRKWDLMIKSKEVKNYMTKKREKYIQKTNTFAHLLASASPWPSPQWMSRSLRRWQNRRILSSPHPMDTPR